MSGILSFLNSIIELIRSFFEIIGTGVAYLIMIVNALPVIIVAPLLAGIAILVIFVILGRGS